MYFFISNLNILNKDKILDGFEGGRATLKEAAVYKINQPG